MVMKTHFMNTPSTITMGYEGGSLLIFWLGVRTIHPSGTDVEITR
jgi:hypothetical protein